MVVQRLRNSLGRLNPSLPATALDNALRKLTHPEGATLDTVNASRGMHYNGNYRAKLIPGSRQYLVLVAGEEGKIHVRTTAVHLMDLLFSKNVTTACLPTVTSVQPRSSMCSRV